MEVLDGILVEQLDFKFVEVDDEDGKLGLFRVFVDSNLGDEDEMVKYIFVDKLDWFHDWAESRWDIDLLVDSKLSHSRMSSVDSDLVLSDEARVNFFVAHEELNDTFAKTFKRVLEDDMAD